MFLGDKMVSFRRIQHKNKKSVCIFAHTKIFAALSLRLALVQNLQKSGHTIIQNFHQIQIYFIILLLRVFERQRIIENIARSDHRMIGLQKSKINSVLKI